MFDQETAAVVVTYKRKELLQVLFDSFIVSHLKPSMIIVVDNDNDPDVDVLCRQFETGLAASNASDIDATIPLCSVVYVPMETNTGGAGGFSKGTQVAYEKGAEWLWLMDDDVMVLPDALEKLRPWMDKAIVDDHRVIQCSRNNAEGKPFFWQYRFLKKLGIHSPFTSSSFREDESFKLMNNACFEGGMFHRSIVSELGYPDNRFFIYWDDAVYGYLASKVTKPILIKDRLMQRTRDIDHINVGKARKLNATSDMSRYYIMRNRGYIAKYLALKGDYSPFLFGLGTLYTVLKEYVRLFITKDFMTGYAALKKGRKDARAIIKNKTWQPMPSLKDQ
jgi:GT2 family glycosyltransferase